MIGRPGSAGFPLARSLAVCETAGKRDRKPATTTDSRKESPA